PRQETGVRVDEDKDVAPESRKNCIQRRSLPRTLSLRDQTESRLALRPILYHAFGSIRATACNHQDLLQQKSGGENLGREGLEQCRKPPSLVVRAYSDTDVRGCVASRAADETSRNGTGRSLLGQHPVRRLNAVLDEAQTEPRRFDDRLAVIRGRNGDLQCDCPRDCQSCCRAREYSELMPLDVYLEPINPRQPERRNELVQRRGLHEDGAYESGGPWSGERIWVQARNAGVRPPRQRQRSRP